MRPSSCAKFLAVLSLVILALPASAQNCPGGPKQIGGKINPSADGVAVATPSNLEAEALNTRSGVAATSSAMVGDLFWFDAGSKWGSWCVGDPIRVAITVTTPSGPYSAVVEKSLTTDNPEIFPDATLTAGPPPSPSATPALTLPVPASDAGATPSTATPTPRSPPTPAATSRPSPTRTPGLSPGAAPATPSPERGPPPLSGGEEAYFLPPLPGGTPRSPGFALLAALLALLAWAARMSRARGP